MSINQNVCVSGVLYHAYARIKRKNGIKPVFTQKHYDLQNTKENHSRVIISRFILRPLICDNLQVAQSAETLG